MPLDADPMSLCQFPHGVSAGNCILDRLCQSLPTTFCNLPGATDRDGVSSNDSKCTAVSSLCNIMTMVSSPAHHVEHVIDHVGFF